MQRVACHVRVSTERQQQAQAIEQQVSRLRWYLAEQHDRVLDKAHLFRDDGCSGAKLQRPGLDALRKQAARTAFDLVLITAPDRLARNYVHQMVVLEELTRSGCQVVFVDRPLSADPHEQLVLQIRGAVAEYERTLFTDRMRRGRLAKLQQGTLLPWTRALYGYRLHPEPPRDPAGVRLAQDEAAIVEAQSTAHANGEATLYLLAKQLTDRGVPSPTGCAHWNVSSVRGILTNPCYTGSAVSGRTRSIPSRQRHSPLLPVGPGYTTQVQPEDQWIRIAVPALITDALFARVQQRLATNRQGAMRSTKYPYLLRRLVSCGLCRLACTGRSRAPAQEQYRYYVCRGKEAPVVSSRDEHCRPHLLPAAQLAALV